MENLKAVWRYYVLAFAGLGLLWLVRERTEIGRASCRERV